MITLTYNIDIKNISYKFGKLVINKQYLDAMRITDINELSVVLHDLSSNDLKHMLLHFIVESDINEEHIKLQCFVTYDVDDGFIIDFMPIGKKIKSLLALSDFADDNIIDKIAKDMFLNEFSHHKINLKYDVDNFRNSCFFFSN